MMHTGSVRGYIPLFADGSRESLERNVWGDPVRRIARDGGITTWTYDDRGALIAKTEHEGTDCEATTRYVRDDRGLLLARIDPLGRRTDYVYYADGRVMAKTEPSDVPGDKRPSILYAYDAVGRVQQISLPGGRTRAFTYDAANRVTSIDYGDGDLERSVYHGPGIHAGLVKEHVDRVGTRTITN